MAKASEQMEKALKVSECVPEIGTVVWTGKIQGATCSSRSAFQALFRPVWAR
jgi:hypothetical protein